MRADRLQALMTERKVDDGQVAAYAGISKSMVFYLRKGERENVSAIILGKLANYFGTSVDYLIGLTDDRSPRTMNLDEELLRLIRVAKELRPHRLADLIDTAEMYREKKQNSTQLMSAVLQAVEDEGGMEMRDQLISLLESLPPGTSVNGLISNSRRLPSSDEGGEPSEGDAQV